MLSLRLELGLPLSGWRALLAPRRLPLHLTSVVRSTSDAIMPGEDYSLVTLRLDEVQRKAAYKKLARSLA